MDDGGGFGRFDPKKLAFHPEAPEDISAKDNVGLAVALFSSYFLLTPAWCIGSLFTAQDSLIVFLTLIQNELSNPSTHKADILGYLVGLLFWK